MRKLKFSDVRKKASEKGEETWQKEKILICMSLRRRNRGDFLAKFWRNTYHQSLANPECPTGIRRMFGFLK